MSENNCNHIDCNHTIGLYFKYCPECGVQLDGESNSKGTTDAAFVSRMIKREMDKWAKDNKKYFKDKS